MRVLLIDADITAFQVSAKVEKAVEWHPDFWTLHSDAKEAKERADIKIAEYKLNFEGDAVVLALSDPDENWRRAVLPTYKSNRKKTRKPLVLPVVRNHLTASYTTIQRPTLEGDDVLGILSTITPTAFYRVTGIKATDRIIISIDKDLKTIPGRMVHREDEGVIETSVDEADYWHMFQTLMGDTTDGYKGCPGIGAVNAKRILEELDPPDYWDAVVQTFQKKKLNEASALQQARVARICRAGDYDFQTAAPIPWTP